MIDKSLDNKLDLFEFFYPGEVIGITGKRGTGKNHFAEVLREDYTTKGKEVVVWDEGFLIFWDSDEILIPVSESIKRDRTRIKNITLIWIAQDKRYVNPLLLEITSKIWICSYERTFFDERNLNIPRKYIQIPYSFSIDIAKLPENHLKVLSGRRSLEERL